MVKQADAADLKSAGESCRFESDLGTNFEEQLCTLGPVERSLGFQPRDAGSIPAGCTIFAVQACIVVWS